MFIKSRGNGSNFNSITINGKTITCSGNNIQVCNGKVIVDGNVIQSDICGDIKVIVNGSCNNVDCAGSVEVTGDAHDIDCGGSCEVKGNVSGSIDAGGSVTCGNVEGDIDAGGSVRCRR